MKSPIRRISEQCACDPVRGFRSGPTMEPTRPAQTLKGPDAALTGQLQRSVTSSRVGPLLLGYLQVELEVLDVRAARAGTAPPKPTYLVNPSVPAPGTDGPTSRTAYPSWASASKGSASAFAATSARDRWSRTIRSTETAIPARPRLRSRSRPGFRTAPARAAVARSVAPDGVTGIHSWSAMGQGRAGGGWPSARPSGCVRQAHDRMPLQRRVGGKRAGLRDEVWASDNSDSRERFFR